MTAASNIVIRPLTPSRWRDLETLFAAGGCSFARSCWCMDYRIGRDPKRPAGLKASEYKRQRLRERTDSKPAPGLLAYRGKEPVGWVTVAPRSDFAALDRSPVMKRVDDEPVWSIVCFVVPAPHRHQGIAHALLEGALAHARRHGARVVEAYPIDKTERGADSWLWHGPRAMFDRAGFEVVARRKPERPVMRKVLSS